MPQEIISFIPFWIVIIPFLAGIAVFLTGITPSRPTVSYDGLLEDTQVTASSGGAGGKLRIIFLLLATLIPFFLNIYLYFLVRQGYVIVSRLDVLPPLGLFFRVDVLGQYMSLIFSFFALILVIYSLGYMKNDPLPQRFFGFMMFVYAGSLGVVLAGDLFSLFLFFEFMSLMYFVLVVHSPSPLAVAAGLKFLFMTILAGVALFLAVVIIFRETGSLALNTSGLVSGVSAFSLLAFIGFIIAFGTKAAMFPLHFWLPDAYTYAPLPAAALSSVIMLKTGVYGLIRVFYNVFGLEFMKAVNWDGIIIIIAAFTIVFGSTIAIAQDDLIRRLAYSGIAQVGYIILGIAIMNQNSLIGASFHVTAHAFMKGCMFLCAGSIIAATGNRSIKKMKGIGYQLPITMLAFTIAAVTSVGMPPFNIFITKWYLSLGALEINQPFLILILLISSLLNGAYYLPIAYHAFMGREEGVGEEELHHREFVRSNFREPRAVMLVPIILLAIGCFVFGLPAQNWPLEVVRAVTAMLY